MIHFSWDAQSNIIIWKDLVFWYLLLDDLCENDLKGEAKAALFEVLLEHEGLLLALSGQILTADRGCTGDIASCGS